MNEFETLLDNIQLRYWETIVENWLNYIPYIQTPGEPPPRTITDVEEISDVPSLINGDTQGLFPIKDIRRVLLHEAIFLLHKAVHVSACSELGLKNGTLTWANSDGYHSSFFAAKSILAFFGVVFVDIQNKPYLIDIWPKPQTRHGSKMKSLTDYDEDILFLNLRNRPTHYEVWYALQRVLRIVRGDVIGKASRNFLLALEPKEFAKIRNRLHYTNNYWTNSDLHSPLIYNHQPIGLKSLSDVGDLSTDDPYFSILVGFLLIYIAAKLLRSLSQGAPVLKQEDALITKSIEASWHEYYHNLTS